LPKFNEISHDYVADFARQNLFIKQKLQNCC
jgi:hypothetical protein